MAAGGQERSGSLCNTHREKRTCVGNKFMDSSILVGVPPLTIFAVRKDE